MNITRPRNRQGTDAHTIPNNERRLISLLEAAIDHPDPTNRHSRKTIRAAKHTDTARVLARLLGNYNAAQLLALHAEGLLDDYSYPGAFLRYEFGGLLQPGDETALHVALDTAIRNNAAGLADDVTPEESALVAYDGQRGSDCIRGGPRSDGFDVVPVTKGPRGQRGRRHPDAQPRRQAEASPRARLRVARSPPPRQPSCPAPHPGSSGTRRGQLQVIRD